MLPPSVQLLPVVPGPALLEYAEYAVGAAVLALVLAGVAFGRRKMRARRRSPPNVITELEGLRAVLEAQRAQIKTELLKVVADLEAARAEGNHLPPAGAVNVLGRPADMNTSADG